MANDEGCAGLPVLGIAAVGTIVYLIWLLAGVLLIVVASAVSGLAIVLAGTVVHHHKHQLRRFHVHFHLPRFSHSHHRYEVPNLSPEERDEIEKIVNDALIWQDIKVSVGHNMDVVVKESEEGHDRAETDASKPR